MKIYIYIVFCSLAIFLQSVKASANNDLITAVKAADPNAVKLILRTEVDVNQQDEKGVSPLMWAAYQGSLSIVNMLLNSGASVNFACTNLNLLPEEPIKYKDTALGLAVSKGHVQVVQTLIAKGADVNSKNNLNRPALMLAIQSGNIVIAKKLIEAGANINAKGGLNENTPLIEAVKTANHSITDLLIKAGAEVDAKNRHGESALGIAHATGLTKIAFLIEASGAKVVTPLYIRIPLILALFFIALAMSLSTISKILPMSKNSVSNKVFSFIIAFTLASVFIAIAWQTPQALDSIITQIFSGFTNLVSSLLSALFLGISIYLSYITYYRILGKQK